MGLLQGPRLMAWTTKSPIRGNHWVSLGCRALLGSVKYSKFQNELKKDLGEMIKLEKVIVAADKSSNFYTCDIPDYKKLRNNNVQKEYRKSTSDAVNTVDKKSGEIAKGLKLDERMQKHSKKECFITLKDHKENFIARPQCRLISPAKSELGRVVKIKLEEINREIRYTTGVNQ